MSNIIKASQITGEYKLEENRYLKKKQELKDEYIEEKDINEEEMTAEEMKAVDEIVLAAKEQAAAIIEEAENTAAAMKNELEQEAENAYQQGFEKGYQEGLEKGSIEGEARTLNELKVLLDSFDSIIKQTKDELDNNIEALQLDVIKLAVQIADKITASQLELNPELINDIVFDMLKELSDVDELNIYINTQLLQYIDQEELKAKFIKQNIEFHADNNLNPGDCIIETNFGGKDGTIENKLNLLERELLKGAGFNEEN